MHNRLPVTQLWLVVTLEKARGSLYGPIAALRARRGCGQGQMNRNGIAAATWSQVCTRSPAASVALDYVLRRCCSMVVLRRCSSHLAVAAWCGMAKGSKHSSDQLQAA